MRSRVPVGRRGDTVYGNDGWCAGLRRRLVERIWKEEMEMIDMRNEKKIANLFWAMLWPIWHISGVENDSRKDIYVLLVAPHVFYGSFEGVRLKVVCLIRLKAKF